MMALRGADTFYIEDCRQVQANTQNIQTLTGQVSRLVGSIENERTYMQCRKMIDDAVRQAQETNVLMTRIKAHQNSVQNSAEGNNRRLMYQKLGDNLSITAKVLEDVVKRFTVEEQNYLARQEQAAHSNPLDSQADLLTGGSASSSSRSDLGIDVEAGDAERRTLIADRTSEADLQRQKGEHLKKINKDMQCLRSIYTDIARHVTHQQESVDTIESQMRSSVYDTSMATEQLEVTRYYKDRTRKRTLCAVGSAGTMAALWIVSYLISG